MLKLLDLPPEILLHIRHFLDFEDILAFRASCQVLLNISVDFMKDQTIFINDCCFPNNFLHWNFECIQRKLHFGEKVTFDLKCYAAFLNKFCSNFTSLSFEWCFRVENIFEIVEHFPKLTELSLKNYNSMAPEKNFEISEALDRTLKNLKCLTVERSFLVDPMMKKLLEKMPSLENLEIDLHFNFLSEMNENVSYLLQAQASKLKHLSLKYCNMNQIIGILDQLPDGQLQLEGLNCTIRQHSANSYLKLFRKQTNLEKLQVNWITSDQIYRETILNMLPHLKELTATFEIEFSGLSFMRGLDELESLTIKFYYFEYGTHNLSCKPDRHIASGLDKVYPKLRKFSISKVDAKICASCWKKITIAFPNLRTLTVSGVVLDVQSCHFIFKNLQLKSLTLSRCRLKNDHLFGTDTTAGIETQRNLNELSLHRTAITAIPALPNIRKLDVSHTEIRSIDSYSKDFPFLLNLCVDSSCYLKISEKTTLPSVTSLNLSWKQLNCWKKISKIFPRLRRLRIIEN